MSVKSSLKKLSPVWFGFVLSAIFVTLVVTAIFTEMVTDKIRDRFTDNLTQKCHDVGFVGIQLERCILKSQDGSKMPYLKAEDCGTTLELVGEDKDFCEENVTKGSFLINLGSFLDSITKPITSLSLTAMGLIISALCVGGLLWRKYT